MSDTLSQNAELLKQNRDAVFRRATRAFVNPPSSSPVSTGAIVAGTRVFDPVSGQEGEVIHVSRENVVVRPTE